MGRVLTNNTALAYAIEASAGVLPGSPDWFQQEPNAIGAFGATISQVARSPISPNRQEQEGTVTDLDSTVEWDGDLTLSHLLAFIEGFLFASAVGPVGFQTTPTQATVTTDVFTIPALASAIPTGRLVYTRGWVNDGNNGLHVVTGGSTTTVIVLGSTLVTETAPTNASLEVAGVEGATGDLQIDANGDLISTTLDFTTLGLTVGQSLYLGTGGANDFAVAANTGYARIVSIAANLIVLEKKGQAFSIDNGAGVDVRVYFGRFIRNVSVDDGDFLEQYYQFEAAWDNLEDPGPGDEWEYAIGNISNELGFQFPGQDKATMSLGFVGLNTDDITTTRKTNAATPILPNQKAAFNTSADIARLRIQNVDESGLTTDFSDFNITFANNASAEKVLGQLGAAFLNTGNFQVTIDTSILFTASAIITAIKNNTTVTMDFSVENSDGAFLVDIPSMKLGGGERDLPVNETVQVSLTGSAFQDAALGYSVGVSIFPHIPGA